MGDRRQKNQLELAFPAEDTSEALRSAGAGTESHAAERISESSAITEQLMEEVCQRENCKQASRSSGLSERALDGSPGTTTKRNLCTAAGKAS
jgi:hypothetical protein